MKVKSFILQVLFFLFIGNIGVQTVFAQTVWDGTADQSWYSASQSQFTITTAEQLARLRQLVNAGTDFKDKTIKLGANILLNNTANWQNWATTPPARTWTPIGTNANKFHGTFDGAGFTISGIYISNNSNFQGLFGSIGGAGVVKNLAVASSYIKGNNSVGGIAGSNHGKILNSRSSATIVGNRMEAQGGIGGLVGFNNSGEISNSYSAGTVNGFLNVGGFVGYNIGRIEASYSTSSVNGSDDHIGGFVGMNSSIIRNSYSTGAVTCDGGKIIATDCGGFVGYNYGGKIYTSYSTSKINKNGGWRYNIGGFIGNNIRTLTKFIIEDYGEKLCDKYTPAGSIPGLCGKLTEIAGNIVGGTPVISSSYYDTQTSGVKNAIGNKASNGITGKTTSDMKNKGTFTSTTPYWNFTSIWNINSGYPYLRSSSSSVVPSSSSGGSSSSSSSDPIPSYYIFAYEGKDAVNMPTAYGYYAAAYVYNGATVDNPKDNYSDGILGVSESVAKLWNVTLADPEEYSGAGIVIDNDTDGIPNISECEKISYYFKGDPHWFLLEFPKDLCDDPESAEDNKWGLQVIPSAQNVWIELTVNLARLKLARSWENAGCGGKNGNLEAVPVDLTKVTKMSWVFDDNVNNGASKNMMITNVACLTPGGEVLDGNAPPKDITVSSGWPIPSYHIFAYKGKNAELDTTTYGNHVGAYVYNGATVNNPEDEEVIGFSEGVAKLWNVTLANPEEYSGAGLVIDNRTAGKPNIADCDEISYYYKGDPHWFLVEFNKELCDEPESADDNKWGLEVTTAQSVWTKKTIDLTTLKLARSWEGAGCGGEEGNIYAVPVDLAKATKISWVFDDNVNDGASKNLMIADVACLTPNGGPIVDNVPPDDITVISGWILPSSSSGGVTSSSAATPSSSSSTITPIRLPQTATANQATQIYNGVNLQAMSKAVLEVYGLNGKLASKQNFGSGVYNVSLGHLPKGMYIVKASFGGEKRILRVPVR